MSFEKAKADLEEKGLGDHVIELSESSATVAEAAHVLGVEPASIAKTLSVLQGEKPELIVTEGTAKLDNHMYKSLFHIKAKMIPYDEVETYVGHAPGGVCPYGVNEGVAVYLDESLRKFDTVYPAAGNGHTAVKLTLQELEAAVGAEGRISVRDEKAPQLVVNRFDPLESFTKQAPPPMAAAPRPAAQEQAVLQASRLYLRLPSEQSPLFGKVRATLNMFPGNVTAVLYFADTGVRRGTQCGLRVDMLQALRALLAEDSVVLK